MTLLSNLGVTEMLCSFIWQIGNEIPELSRLQFFEKFLSNNFAIFDAEGC